MAYLHARATGNFTAAATWGVCDATSLLDSQSSNQVLTTAFVSSAAFTPGAITIDGIAIKIAGRALTPSGTITVRLATGGVAVAGTTVTINVSDIPDDVIAAANTHRGCSIGWWFFAFAPVTLVAATAYTVQALTSAVSQVNVFTNGTAGNWSRFLRTTTTAAPAAGDSMFAGGEWTAAATKTDRAVALDTILATDYGGASLIVASLGISKGGSLTRAAAATVFRMSGVVQFWLESSHNLTGAPTTTFRWEFDNAADGDFGLVSFAGLSFSGSDPWGTGIARTRLTADAAAAATTLTVADVTGWKLGDVIALAGTRRVTAEAEERPLSVAASGTTLTFAAGLAVAHDGSAANKIQADVVNITRNVHMTVVSAAFASYISVLMGNMVCAWSAFEYIGTGTAGKAGFDFDGGVHTFDFCAFARSEDDLFFPVLLGAATLTLTDCVAWDCVSVTAGQLIQAAGTGNNTFVVTRGAFLADGRAGQSGIYVGLGSTLTMTHTRMSGFTSNGCIRIDGPVEVVVEDSEFYNNSITGGAPVFCNANNIGHRYRRNRFWRNLNVAVSVVNSFDIEFEGNEHYGNGTAGMNLDDSQVRILDGIFASEAGFAQASGVSTTMAENDASNYQFHGCTFSPVGGTRIAATTDVNLGTGARSHQLFSGCTFGAPTEISTGALPAGSTLAIQRRDGVVNAHSFRKYSYGQVDYETGTVGVASPGMKLTPEAALRKFESVRMGKAVAATKLITFSVSVRKNAAYNGSAPRFLLKANGAVGVRADVVLDTHAAAADVWEVLTGQSVAAEEDGVLEVVVECSGTAGNVFVDDFVAVST